MAKRKYLEELRGHFSKDRERKNPMPQHVIDKSDLKGVHMRSERSAKEPSHTPPLSPIRCALPRKDLKLHSGNRNSPVPRQLTDGHRKKLQHEQQRSLPIKYQQRHNAPNEAGEDHSDFTDHDMNAKLRNNKCLDREMEQFNSKQREEAMSSKETATKQMMSSYRDEPQMMGGHRDEPQMMAGYRDEPQMMAGYRDEPQMMSSYRDEPQMMAGYRDEPQMMGGHRDEPQMMAGYRDEPQMKAGYRDEPQMMAGYRDEPQMMAGYPDEPQMMGAYRDESQMVAGYRDEPWMMEGFRDEPQREQLQERHIYKNDFVGCVGGRDESAVRKMDIYQHKQHFLMRDHQASGDYRNATRDRQQQFKDYNNKNKDKDASAVGTMPRCSRERKLDNERSVGNRWSGTYVVQKDCTKDRYFDRNPQFDACDGRDVPAACRMHKMESGGDRHHSKYHESAAFYEKRKGVMKHPSELSTSNRSNKSHQSSYLKSHTKEKDWNEIKKPHISDVAIKCLDSNKDMHGDQLTVGRDHSQLEEIEPVVKSDKSYHSSHTRAQDDQEIDEIKTQGQVINKAVEKEGRPKSENKYSYCVDGNYAQTMEPVTSPKNRSNKSYISSVTSSENDQDVNKIKMERQIDKDDFYFKYFECGFKRERMRKELPALDKPTNNTLDNADVEQSQLGENEETALSATSEIGCKDFDKNIMEYLVAYEALQGANRTVEQIQDDFIAFDEKEEDIMEDPPTFSDLDSAGEQQTQVEESSPVSSFKHFDKEESMVEQLATFGNNLDSSQHEESGSVISTRYKQSTDSFNKNFKYVKDIKKKQSTIEYIDSLIAKGKEESRLHFTKSFFDDYELKKNSRKSQYKARDFQNIHNKDIFADVAGSGLSVEEIFTYKVMTPIMHKMQRTFTRHRADELSILEDLQRLPAIFKKLCNKENPKKP